jgi:hypothetical protein
MEHPSFQGVLAVGCICAGHMEGDVSAARGREASMRSRASKRTRWLTRNWRMSAKGNPTIKADGFRVTVYARGQGFAPQSPHRMATACITPGGITRQ